MQYSLYGILIQGSQSIISFNVRTGHDERIKLWWLTSQQDLNHLRFLHFKAMVFPVYNFVSTSIFKRNGHFLNQIYDICYHTGIREYYHNVEYLSKGQIRFSCSYCWIEKWRGQFLPSGIHYTVTMKIVPSPPQNPF